MKLYRLLKSALASAWESLKIPRAIHEMPVKAVGQLEFNFTYNNATYAVTVRCNEVRYRCNYHGLLKYSRDFPLYVVYAAIAGAAERSELHEVFDMVVWFPPIANPMSSSQQQGKAAIDAYIAVISRRFKNQVSHRAFQTTQST